MREEKPQEASSSSSSSRTQSGPKVNAWKGGSRRYKLWALGAIVFLALCSILTTASLLLKGYAQAASSSSQDASGRKTGADLDVLDLEEREKTVKQMWSTYQQRSSSLAQVQSFWREAFAAAYEELTSDVPGVRDAAVVEIAKMSLRSRLVILHDSSPGSVFKAQEGRLRKTNRGRKL